MTTMETCNLRNLASRHPSSSRNRNSRLCLPAGSSSRPAKEMSVVPETPQHYSTSPERDIQSTSTTHHAGQKRKRAQDEDTVLPTLTEPMCFEDFRPKEQNGSFDFSVYEPIYTRYLLDCKRFVSINPPAEENVLASRDELNKQYCCGAFNLLATIPANKSPSPDGEALRLLFPSRDLSPLSVTQAGRPGLLFTSRTDIGVDETPLHVFSEHTSEDKIRWSYVGEYTLAPAGRIESAQFAGFPANIQLMWGRLVAEKDHQEGYLAMRARIALRKTVDDPKEEDVKHEMKKVEVGKGIRVSPADVVDALSSGDECINILRMERMGYDHAFADDLQEKFPPKAAPRTSKNRRASVRRKQDDVKPPASSELRRSKRDRKARVLGPVIPEIYKDES
ncbi:hypothetical protein BDZ89DRAFT_713270 [Hymenopellis radicata]|nr:hypothetical protein BDZ89DRAFT_713270 [Hymenopellis radicata]